MIAHFFDETRKDRDEVDIFVRWNNRLKLVCGFILEPSHVPERSITSCPDFSTAQRHHILEQAKMIAAVQLRILKIYDGPPIDCRMKLSAYFSLIKYTLSRTSIWSLHPSQRLHTIISLNEELLNLWSVWFNFKTRVDDLERTAVRSKKYLGFRICLAVVVFVS